jgi:hypothetical protein
MSDDAQDAATEAAEAAQAAADEIAEGSPVGEAPAEEAVAEAPADEPVAEETTEVEAVAEEAPADEPVADEPVAEEAPAEDEPVAEEAPATVGGAFGPVRVARVYICERGHRTTTLWGEPDTCQAQPLRHGPNCGLKLYHITELPEQVQKALNPLKASKKASKKK